MTTADRIDLGRNVAGSHAADRVIALDVGNSAVKAMVVDANANASAEERKPLDSTAGETRSFEISGNRWGDELCHWIDAFVGGNLACWVSTVNRATSVPLESVIRTRFGQRLVRWQVVTCEHVPLATEVDFPDRLGIDRLLGAYAASSRFPGSLVVVDAGSAVTVDWVHRRSATDACFVGGAILPGLRLQQAALVTGPEGLRSGAGPRQGRTIGESLSEDPVGRRLRPGRNTQQAIEIGVTAALAGAVDRLAGDYVAGYTDADPALVSGARSEIAEQPVVVVSGGDGPLLSRFLRTKHVLVPSLVCLGALDLAMQRCQNPTSGLE